MSKIKLIENQWVDIVIPPPPETQMLLWWLITIALFSIIIFIARIIWLRQSRQRLKRNIRSLLRMSALENKNNLNTGQKYILQQLEKLLCQHCHVAQLIHIKLNHSQWPLFREQLQQASYQATTTDQKQTQTLLSQASGIFFELKTGKDK